MMITRVESHPGVPKGWPHVTPRIVVFDAGGLVAFIRYVFGAHGEYDPAAPAILTIGDSKIMISDAGAREPHRAFLHVYVGDVDATFRRALERGARVLEEAFDTPYGDRRGMIADSWGNTWQIAAHKGAEAVD